MKKIKKESKEEKMSKESDEVERYDFIILGAGVTGLAAAMYGARLGLRTLCLGATHSAELPIGGVITTTNIVENYPGFIRLSGPELAENIKKHAESYELVKIKEEKAESVEKKGNDFIIKTDKNVYHAKTILFATGTKWKTLDVPGSKEFENKGVAYCALCDSPLFRNKIVGLVGGSDSAAKDALVLTEHAKKVYIIYRGEEIHPEPINMERVEEKVKEGKIEIINKANVKEIKGEKFVSSVILDREFNGKKELGLQGLFIAIGHIPLSELAKNIGVKINEKGEIIIDHKTSETNIEGVYAAGDVADKPFKQAITGVAEGCTAAYSAYEYVTKGKVEVS
ncbi:FAD-dependent oxidoreductase [Candidatus Pacearchaeota archaeon]|nr:FAD-dependent oxidoreductase [Candidatus Pacearchaeota archaeon]